ncbi:MFS transporter [Natronoglycomyces albus]|uniref:MFS transporter n=1 Tax=Natronoglycomyces albus TaxID=2811108 RepID=A0A895XHP1_9ACTN|nr:MFS transporter [Natronoglycomyces albus]QSB05351.1 hypothetical protein JQS30_16650 [Natronoglycomyces albus]
MRTEGHMRILARTGKFRRLLAVRLTSQASDGVFQASLAFSVFFNPDVVGADPLAYAAAVAVLIGPYSLLGPYVGVVLDRFPRRNLIAAVNIGRCGVVLGVSTAIALSWPMWIWIFLAMIAIASNRFILAGVTASHPHVVETPQLVTANSVASTAGAAVFGLGLATTGLLQLFGSGAWSYALLAALGAAGYLTAGLLAVRLFAAMDLGPDDNERTTTSVLGEIAAISRGMITGLRHLAGRKGPAYVIALQGLHRMLYGILFVVAVTMLLVYFWDRLADPDASGPLAWLIAIAVLGNVGVVIAAFITPKATRTLGSHRWVVLLLTLAAFTVAGIGATMMQMSFVVAVLLINIASQGIKIVADTSLQSRIDDAYRGRVFSLNDTVYNVSYLLGLFIGGLIVPADGYAPGIVFGLACAWALAAIGYHFTARTAWPYVDAPGPSAQRQTAQNTSA